MVTRAGLVKILDFGLAKVTEPVNAQDSPTVTMRTAAGVVLGTVAYMSPEQAEGKPVDSRSDIFSFGSVLYEMVTRRRAFEGSTTLSILASILRVDPRPVRAVIANASAELEEIIARCLRKHPNERVQRIDDVRAQLDALRARTVPASKSRRTGLAVAATIAILLTIGLFSWLWRQNRNTAWAYEQAIPEIRRLMDRYDYTEALALVDRAAVFIPGDTGLAELRQNSSLQVKVMSDPTGTVAAIRPYGAGAWRVLGSTPMENLRIPRGWLEWKFSKDGYAEVTRVLNSQPNVTVKMLVMSEVPPGMIFVAGAPSFNVPILKLTHLFGMPVHDFYVDKFEVTNRQYKQFVEQGGYKRREFWKQPFVENGKEIPWDEAIARFRDKTGVAGPSTWELGEYPTGHDEYPVTGVSWYEAAAYAEFAGKSLPPIAYWSRAAAPTLASHLFVSKSNFSGSGLRAVGASSAMNVLGLYDVAGNAKEWCWNEAGVNTGMRFILGGGFRDPNYLFNDADAQSAFARSDSFGFRLVKYSDDAPLSAAVKNPASAWKRDYSKEKPVSEETFNQYARFYTYDKTPLDAVVEYSRDEQYWRKEKVVYNAAYNHERIPAFLFLPKSASPPFQTLVYYPGSGAQNETNNDNIEFDRVSFLVKSGRAVLFPIYKGTYERGDGVVVPPGSTVHRDRRIQQYQDVARSVDYLETRQDIDRTKLGYYGFSWGGGMGAHFPALEKRFKVSVLALAGFRMEPVLPEVDSFNFASHVTIPTLMLSGRYDFTFPVEQSQKPFFERLGATEKRQIMFDIGHAFLPIEFARESIAWIDKYLGPVN